MAQIWADTLGLDTVGIQDDFLDLGGTSLVAGRIASQVCERFQVVVPLRGLLDASRVADMAAVVVTKLLQTVAPDAADRLLAQLERPETDPRMSSEPA